MNTIIAVDYENIPLKTFNSINQKYTNSFIHVFLGKQNTKIPSSLLLSMNQKNKVVWHQIHEAGKNNLDFFIYFQLGYFLGINSNINKVVIYSKDKDFNLMKECLENKKVDLVYEE